MTTQFEFFKREEFACKCCGENKISPKLVELLNEARACAGIPFRITSGYRCKKHNAKVGGVANSSHLTGLAVDIACNTDRERFLIIMCLLDVGFKRIGIGDNFIHADIDTTKPQGVIWRY